MIALDSSALLAIAFEEDEAETFKRMIAEHRCLVGWATLFETHIVLRNRLGAAEVPSIDELTTRPSVTQVAFDRPLFEAACRAYENYGRRKSRGGLNFGDCLTYAVAKVHDVPLLFKGDDFRLTDLRSALP